MTTCDSAAETTSPVIRHKRGDGFAPVVQVVDESTGLPLIDGIAGWDISSQIRNASGDLVAALSVTDRDDAECKYRLDAGVTSAWPIGRLEWDIKYVVGGIPMRTETRMIQVIRSVTE